jgi:hypothetical protein
MGHQPMGHEVTSTPEMGEYRLEIGTDTVFVLAPRGIVRGFDTRGEPCLIRGEFSIELPEADLPQAAAALGVAQLIVGAGPDWEGMVSPAMLVMPAEAKLQLLAMLPPDMADQARAVIVAAEPVPVETVRTVRNALMASDPDCPAVPVLEAALLRFNRQHPGVGSSVTSPTS